MEMLVFVVVAAEVFFLLFFESHTREIKFHASFHQVFSHL